MSNKIFNSIKSTRPPSNTFDLSHDRKFSMRMGELTPILAMDILPGDKISLNCSQMLRLAPMIAPVMHKMNIFTHFYFVPNRLTWQNWEDFITGGEDGLQEPVFPKIKLELEDIAPGTLGDYLGIPSEVNTISEEVSALPWAAYQMIYNEYYRDQNLIDKVPGTNLSDGVQSVPAMVELSKLRKRAWEHDYFTSALPWTQKGAEATIPLGQTAEIKNSTITSQQLSQRMKADHGGIINNLDLATGTTSAFGDTGNTQDWWLQLNNSHYVDLSTATAASINDLRQAFKLQEWLEKNARGGTRYIESIKSHFGVTSPDSRLQRPEYLGGGSAPIVISEVLQQSATDVSETVASTPQGNMAGHGISVGQSNNFSFTATEHGYVIGLMTVMPRTAYFQGIPKQYKKFDKFDYYWPSFAHLGEQPILNQELFVQGDAKDQETFGYTPRYAEYKHALSTVHGEMRTSLDFWHYARKFDNPPALNQEFIDCEPDGRIFAVQNTKDQVYVHLFNKIKARRLMPVFGTPSL